MSQREGQEARTPQDAIAYHEATKLSYINLRNKPPLYKSYPGLPKVPLPAGFPHPDTDTLGAVASTVLGNEASLDLSNLAQLLFFSSGLVRKSDYPATGEVHYRAAASAGALYPIEVYLVCKDLPGIEAGVYHFSPEEFALSRLRKGDFRGALSQAAGNDEAIASAPGTLVFTTIFWRSAWKYRARSYRYCFWDNGTVLANLLATASSAGLPIQVIAGFVDDEVNRTLGINSEHEAGLCLVPVGKAPGPQEDRQLSATRTLTPEVIAPAVTSAIASDGGGPFSDEIDYPEIRRLHTASSLTGGDEVREWRGILEQEEPQSQGAFYPVETLDAGYMSSIGLGKVVLDRGSTRRFDREAISFAQLSAILSASTGGIKADFLGPGGASLLDIYVIANAVDGLIPGAYFLSRQRRGLEALKEGESREESGHLCFEQALGADASAVFFLMADLERVDRRYGDRGYRAAQLEAGILGGRTYLCAHSLGLGATGLTFYDDDVTEFFSPHAQGRSTMFVVALGVKARNNRVRPFRSRVGVLLDALARGARRP